MRVSMLQDTSLYEQHVAAQRLGTGLDEFSHAMPEPIRCPPHVHYIQNKWLEWGIQVMDAIGLR